MKSLKEQIKSLEKVTVNQISHSVSNTPKVSVCIQTYQHADYISQCLDGVLMQQTNFQIEILLGEDESTDGTREICLKYAQNYPDKIRLFLHSRENNIKINGQPTGRFNLLYNLNQVKGEYIAMCEGDDFWTDPQKLQKQVDFLDENEEYAICHHSYQIYNKGNVNEYLSSHKIAPPYKASLLDLAAGNFIGTLTVMYRNNFKIPDWFAQLGIGDYPMHLLRAQYGSVGFINEQMAIYRIHEDGMSRKGSNFFLVQRFIHTFEILFSNTNFDLSIISLINIQMIKLLLTTIFICDENKSENKMIEAFGKLKHLFYNTQKIPEDVVNDIFNVSKLMSNLFLKKAQLKEAKDSIVFLKSRIPEYALVEIFNSKKLIYQYANSRSYNIGHFLVKWFNVFKKK